MYKDYWEKWMLIVTLLPLNSNEGLLMLAARKIIIISITTTCNMGEKRDLMNSNYENFGLMFS